LGYLPKISLLREKSFDFNFFGGEDVEGKKMLFHIFFEVLMVGQCLIRVLLFSLLNGD
jgi:hypothetical protein